MLGPRLLRGWISFLLLCLSVWRACAAESASFAQHVLSEQASLWTDSAEYFLGNQNKPKIEILSPRNGEILDTRELKIRVTVEGYETPSSLHSSSMCVGLSSGAEYSEQCFDQTDLTFHANGLLAGANYGLRVALFERGQAIAVSVRSFRVGGVRGVPTLAEEIVTIKTAVQLAVQYQTKGLEAQAEEIYRRILDEHPQYPDALHLMGVVYYHRGDALTAVQYVERALQSTGNFSFDGFHNTLGVCYRTLGRADEAKEQFQVALALSPDLLSAQYNLGLVYQEKNDWESAVEIYRNVTKHLAAFPNAISADKAAECKVRECDLLLAMYRFQESLQCWKDGTVLFPRIATFHHELGDLQGRLGQLEPALESFKAAASLGRFLSYLNAAHIVEQLGYWKESRDTYEAVLAELQTMRTPSFHVKLRLAPKLPSAR